MPVSIKGSGGGSVTLDAGAAAADTTLTLPNTSGTILQSGTAVTVAQGGTGAATLTANAVLIGNGTSAVTAVAPSTNGNVLTSNGTAWTSAAPATPAAPAALSTASGSAPSYSARAWASWIANGTISASGNVTSVTNTSTGLYTIAFTTAMQDANYAVVTGQSSVGAANAFPAYYGRDPSTAYAPAAGSFVLSFRNSSNTPSNADYVSIAVFR